MFRIGSQKKTNSKKRLVLATVATGTVFSLVTLISVRNHPALHSPVKLSHAAISSHLSHATSSRTASSRLPLQVGHTYLLTQNEMKGISGASNLQIKQGTVGVDMNPRGGSEADQAFPSGYWEINPPNSPDINGPGPSQGWNVTYNATSGLRITVPTNAPIDRGYYVLYVTHSTRTPDGQGGFIYDSLGPAATFDVISK